MRASAAYFDTSVVVKRYVNELASVRARGLLRRFRPVLSAVALVELSSAVRRRTNAGELSEAAMTAVLRRIDDDRRRWQLIDVTAPVLNRAETLALELGIAALDAIHVASAATLAEGLGRHVAFVTADARQRSAAARVNLEVVWVE